MRIHIDANPKSNRNRSAGLYSTESKNHTARIHKLKMCGQWNRKSRAKSSGLSGINKQPGKTHVRNVAASLKRDGK